MRCIAVLYSKPFENFIAPYTTEYRYKVRGNQIFYSLPKSQLTLVNLLFKLLDDGSALNLKVVQKELVATSKISINWGDLNLQELIKMLGVVRLSNHDQ